jgi:hypothetical protein
VSHEAVEWALEILGLRPPIKLVLVALAERADARGGSCHPGLTELTRRASTSRRRVIEAIALLEDVGAVQVHRSVASEGKRRSVNRYQLAVGKTIAVPKKATAKKGTRLVPHGNQVGSPGYTGTFLEPSLNPHSETYVSARFSENPRDEHFQQDDPKLPGRSGQQGSEATSGFPDHAMIAAAQASGVDPDQLCDIITDYRGELSEESEAGDRRAQKQYRTLWFAILNGKAPDLEDKL